MVKIEVELPEDLHRFLEEYSKIKDMTLNELLRGLLISDVRGLIDDLQEYDAIKLLKLESLL